MQEVRKEMADTITVTKADMQKMIVTDKTELDSALRDLQTEVKSTQSTDPIKFSEIIKQELENTSSTSQSQIQEINHKLNETRNNLQEDQDKEARRNNIIIYRIPESDASCIEERKIMDSRFVLGLLTKMEVGICENDIRGSFRLGKWSMNGDARPETSPRPMLVQLTKRTAKNLIMEHLYKFKHLEAHYKNVILAHDMRKQERIECKTLVEDAKKQTAEDITGNYIQEHQGR